MEVLEPTAYGGYKDVNAAWMAGALTIGERAVALNDPTGLELPAASMECDGGLARPEAQHAAPP